MLKILLITLISIGNVWTQDGDCNFFNNIGASDRVPIESPNYPGNYSAGRQCRWIGSCPEGTRCRLDCELYLPLSTGCSQDRVLISRSGDPSLMMAERYCGRQTFNVLSINRSISVALIVPGSSNGGRFRCILSAQSTSSPPGCRCGERRQTRIVGGTSTGIHEYPMMAGLYDGGARQVFCGAVFIQSQYLITAAHCLESLPPNVSVVAGNRNYRDATKYAISYFIPHPDYNPNTFDNDIAIVVLQSGIQFDYDTIGPACLPFKYYYSDLAGANVTILGWGTLFFGGPVSVDLQKAEVRVITQQQCQQTEPNINSNKVCTFARGRDACQMDSGGPALYTDPQTGRLFSVGVISEGESCASSRPGINTRVTAMLRFILDNTRTTYCVQQ